MRTINNLPNGTPRDSTAAFPDGNIVNEVGAQKGTPVVREIYGDVLVNLYALMRLAGVIPNGIEDGALTQLQLVEALQKLANVQNDIEQSLNLNSLQFSINLDITALPSKYFVLAKALANYDSTKVYTFKGSKPAPIYNFTSPTGFKVGDEVLLILDKTGVRGIGLAASTLAKEIDKTAGDILGIDPDFYIDLSGSNFPQYPAVVTVYVNNVPIAPMTYNPTDQTLHGFTDPVGEPGQAIKILYI